MGNDKIKQGENMKIRTRHSKEKHRNLNKEK